MSARRRALRLAIGALAAAAVPLSVAAAGAFALVPIAWLAFPAFTPPRPLLLGLGAAAFASNVIRHLHPVARAGAALVQAVCVFEILGFAAGLTITVYAGAVRWQIPDWPAWLVSMGLLLVGGGAMTSSALALRVTR